MKSRDDRRILFKQRERELIYDGLREIWNNTPARHTKVRHEIESLMDEFSDEEVER